LPEIIYSKTPHPGRPLRRIYRHEGPSSLHLYRLNFQIERSDYIIMNSKKIVSIGTGLAMAATMALAMPAFAEINVGVGANVGVNQSGAQGQGDNQQDQQNRPGMPWGGPGGANHPGMPAGMMKPGVFGTVTAINSNIITISGRQGFGSTSAAVSYSVDATNATVKKNNATSTVSAIAVGDTIFAQGTITGTNVVATNIRDGVIPTGMRSPGQPGNKNGKPGMGSSTSPILGNGQPVIAGTVSAVSGTSLTITTTSNVTYTVDASNAKVIQGQNTATTLSSVAVGNKVLIQGTVNGTSITASTVIDQSTTGGTPAPGGKAQSHGFLGGIGSFFMHLFGF